MAWLLSVCSNDLPRVEDGGKRTYAMQPLAATYAPVVYNLGLAFQPRLSKIIYYA